MTPAYPDIRSVHYDRRSDSIGATILSGNTWQTSITRADTTFSLTGDALDGLLIHDRIYTVGKDGKISSVSGVLEDQRLIGDTQTLLIQSGSDWNIRSDTVSWSLDATGSIIDPILSQDRMTLAWLTRSGLGMSMMKMGRAV